jgi:hypothetical protein
MNRRDIRIMKHMKHQVGDWVNISEGVLQERDPNYGLRVTCYVCGTPHLARGVAYIEDKSGASVVPLCDPCVGADVSNRIVKKYWSWLDLEFSEGGELTEEQLLALVEGQGSVRQ